MKKLTTVLYALTGDKAIGMILALDIYIYKDIYTRNDMITNLKRIVKKHLTKQ